MLVLRDVGIGAAGKQHVHNLRACMHARIEHAHVRHPRISGSH